MPIRAMLVFMLTAVSGLHAQKPQAFHDAQDRFTVHVPPGWRAVALNEDCIQISNGGAYLTVIITGGDPGMAITVIAHQFSGQWHGFTKLREGEAQIDGRAAMSATYGGVNPQGADANLKLTAMSDGGRTYLLMTSAKKAEYQRSKGDLDQIEQSFHVIAARGGNPAESPARPVAPAVPAGEPMKPASRPAGGVHANYFRMKKVAVVDERGFERPMQAMSLLIPADWQFQGSVQYNPNTACHPDMVGLAFRATSPDGRFGIEMFPDHHWQWSGDPQMVRMMQMSNQQMAQYGRKSCELMPPMDAGQYLERYVAPGLRRGARIVGLEPMTEMAQQLRQQASKEENVAAMQGMRAQVRADVARVRLEYNAGGQEVEEWLAAETIVTGMAGPSFDMRTGRMGQAMYYDCGGYLVTAMRAPQGQLQSMEKFFLMVLSTIRLDPQWESRVTQVMAQMYADDSRAAMQRSAIATQYGRDTSRMINQGYQSRSKMQDSAFHQWDQAIRGVETFRNPNTGETVELDNRYGQAWAGGGNQYILSESEGFNPNAAVGGNWTRMEPVKP